MSESEYGRGFARDVEKINETLMLQFQTGIQVFYGEDLRRAYRKAGLPLSEELAEHKPIVFEFEGGEPPLDYDRDYEAEPVEGEWPDEPDDYTEEGEPDA